MRALILAASIALVPAQLQFLPAVTSSVEVKDESRKFEVHANAICPFANRATFAAGFMDEVPEIKSQPTSGEVNIAEKCGVECLQQWGAFSNMSVGEIKSLKENYVMSINPKGEVPALRTANGDIIVESEIVAEFLDHFSTRASLVPSEPVLAAKVRLAMKRFNDVIGACYRLLLNQDPAADFELAATIKSNLETFATALDTTSDFCVSDKPTLADVHCGPFLWRFSHLLPYYRGYDLFTGVPGKLKMLLSKIEALPELHKLNPISAEQIIEAYEGYSNGKIMAESPKPGAVWAGRGRSEMGK